MNQDVFINFQNEHTTKKTVYWLLWSFECHSTWDTSLHIGLLTRYFCSKWCLHLSQYLELGLGLGLECSKGRSDTIGFTSPLFFLISQLETISTKSLAATFSPKNFISQLEMVSIRNVLQVIFGEVYLFISPVESFMIEREAFIA